MAWAEENAPTPAPVVSPATTADCNGSKGFAPHQDNYVVIGQQQNNGWSQADNVAVRVQYSTKYSIVGCPKNFDNSLNAQDLEVFVSYTGMFDFYAHTRDSDPVINRVSNPGLHLRLPGSTIHLPGSSWELSLEHRSDGQVFESTTPEGTLVAQQMYDAANQKSREFFDTLSRGANFLGLQVAWTNTVQGKPVHYHLKGHAYFNQSSEITWGPLKNSGRTIRNYDLLQWRAETLIPDFGYVGANWRVGSSGLKTDSLDVWWQATWSVPVYVRAHFGPMNTLSNYTQNQNAIGVGLRFWDF